MSITEFINARIAEDKEAVERIKSEECHGIESLAEADYFRFVYRAEAEIEAKRRLMERHGGRHICEDGMAGERWDDEANDLIDWPCDDARIIAAIWSDHADYEEGWSA